MLLQSSTVNQFIIDHLPECSDYTTDIQFCLHLREKVPTRPQPSFLPCGTCRSTLPGAMESLMKAGRTWCWSLGTSQSWPAARYSLQADSQQVADSKSQRNLPNSCVNPYCVIWPLALYNLAFFNFLILCRAVQGLDIT